MITLMKGAMKQTDTQNSSVFSFAAYTHTRKLRVTLVRMRIPSISRQWHTY